MTKKTTRSPRPSTRKTSAQQQTLGQGADTGVLVSILLLASMGMVMSYSTTATLALDQTLPPLFLRHVGALGVGLATAAAIMWTPIDKWRRLALPLWILSLGLLLAVEFFGVKVNGAQRWLEVPGLGFRFQPVELCKLTTLLLVAALVARRDGRDELSGTRTLIAASLALPPMALLLLQPDLGNAVLLACLVGLLLIVAGTRLSRLIAPGLIGIAGIVVYISYNPYAWRRITGFMHPWATSQGEGYQLTQSFVAFGRGGLFGVGLGNGEQKLAYLPEAHTDFILSLVAEELGLVGVLVVLGGFVCLLLAGSRIAARARDRFALLVAFGMTSLLTVPAIINSAVVMGMMPTKGLTLPFLSYGRTSLVMCCVALGLLLSAAREPAGSRSRARRKR
ncbi:MAG: putative lipid II flippase FtsW [Myxococcota bacterium]|jgi:cell division protein FtsW|nr:putative lipid II flippase FtsW [Myxococcota bacterium]